MEHIISVLLHVGKWLYPLGALLLMAPKFAFAGMLSGLPDQPEIIQLVNSVLLTVLGVMMGWIRFFLRDLHRSFKGLEVKVGTVSAKLDTHIAVFERVEHLYDRERADLGKRIERLESTPKP